MNSTMRSLVQSLISDFEAANGHLVAPTDVFLDRVCPDGELHFRFMNTLSLMEHMGSQKIMATQSNAALSQETLKHLAEEARHAFFFKRQAERAAKRPLSYDPADMLAPSFARMYFQRLEAGIKRAFADSTSHPEAVYLYTSMTIEFRAAWAYHLYQDAVERAGVKMSLKSLLAEEQGHLTDMAERLDGIGAFSAERTRTFCAMETRLYERLLGALSASVLKAAA